ERAYERHVLLDQLLARVEVALLVVLAQQDLVVDAGHYAALAFANATQAPPSRSSTCTRSTTVSRTRRRPNSLPSRCSSRSASAANGPTAARTVSGSTVTTSETWPPSSRQASSASTATCRSSSCS